MTYLWLRTLNQSNKPQALRFFWFFFYFLNTRTTTSHWHGVRWEWHHSEDVCGKSELFVLKSGGRERTLSDFFLFLWIAAGGLLQVAAYSLFRWQWQSRGAAGFINHDGRAAMLHRQTEKESFALELNFFAINTCSDSARNCWDRWC